MLPVLFSFGVLLGCTYAITDRACEGGTLYLSCPRGQSINVTYANYGRTNPFSCSSGGPQSTNCYSPYALQTVRRTCQGQNQCSISASDSLFGDPCPQTYKYLEVDYECERSPGQGNRFYTCEGGSLYIYCPAGSYLVVFSANYGRLSSDVCPGPGSNNINCESPGSVDVVRNYCEGLTNCQLEASNAMFGDPCPGTYKYLEVNIGCRY
uniref:L-rhamnose-binding lectin CSL3-like n=1 Tax=Crassostrea virginica TaxID=6565 RepID=A0A8B8EWS4_CRAVI|nr:L-rhamnose-binding lectin CSL3-like [Crassostrea virginica]